MFIHNWNFQQLHSSWNYLLWWW